MTRREKFANIAATKNYLENLLYHRKENFLNAALQKEIIRLEKEREKLLKNGENH